MHIFRTSTRSHWLANARQLTVGWLLAGLPLGAAWSAPAANPPSASLTNAAEATTTEGTLGHIASLTLRDAIVRAERGNPVLRAKQAQRAAAEGVSVEASVLLFNNPQLSLDATARSVQQAGMGNERYRETGLGVSQSFEVAGQPGYRREGAQAALDALRLEIDDTRQQQRADVAQRFYRVLALQQRVELEALAARLFDETARAVERRRAAGEDTRLDANVARVEAERAINQLAQVREQLIEARSALAVPLQLPPEQLPQVSGALGLDPLEYAEGDLMERARSQPRLQALALRQRSAQARLKLAQAARYPDVTLGLSTGREGPPGSRERFTRLTLSLPLPLFNQNQAGIGAAVTETTQAELEREVAERDAPAAVHALWLRLQSLRQRVERLQQSVVPTLSVNEQLSGKSLKAGQIGLLELIVANRQSIDARRDLIDAQLDYHTARLSLEAAAGWSSAQ